MATPIQHEDDQQLLKPVAGLVVPADLGSVESNDVVCSAITCANTESEQHLTESRAVTTPALMTSVDDLDEVVISRLRQFFELLDRWDREALGKPTGHGKKSCHQS